MRYFSTLAGPLRTVKVKEDFSVKFQSILFVDNMFSRFWTRFISLGSLGVALWFGAVLFNPKNWVIIQQPHSHLHLANLVMLVCLFLLQIVAIMLTVSATRSTLKARNPIPAKPQKGLKVAFATTRAPGEPVDMVRTTLEASKKLIKAGAIVDVWLLDETRDRELKKICKELGVKYFSRFGIEEWNTPKYQPRHVRRLLGVMCWFVTFGQLDKRLNIPKSNPYYEAKTKHGNFNSWRAHLARKNIHYDILAGVDTDHIPEPNYLERLLGYFRDADVAYVVGPQVYANYGPGISKLVPRLAESQASFFQSTIQRAGNASTSPMFVGTNYAVRMDVLDQINGFQPCITEDMATGLAIHAQRNPATGNRWKSVYTPDVLALGEGPEVWGTLFTQQWRWAAGTFDTWKKMVWRKFHKLSRGAMVHYFLILTYYPLSALAWLLSVVSSLVYLLTGATAIIAPWNQFVSLYMMVVVMQLSLYFWNRRFNVSPHEPLGSYGIGGMAVSTLMAPVYFSAFIGILFGKKPQFVVTKKGSSNSEDRIGAFNIHLKWAALITAGLLYGYTHGHHHPAMIIWVGGLLLICLAPPLLGLTVTAQRTYKKSLRSLKVAFNTKFKEERASNA